jgi:hypothetical protein
MKYLIRILVLPFVAGIDLVTSVKLFFMFCKDFLLYGGEMMTYRKGHTPTTVADILNFVKEKMNSEQGAQASVASKVEDGTIG